MSSSCPTPCCLGRTLLFVPVGAPTLLLVAVAAAAARALGCSGGSQLGHALRVALLRVLDRPGSEAEAEEHSMFGQFGG